ncbi:Nuclear pore complex protein [Nymphaea thermarum]|nr:Nuclear pore complex protein [Nymphaea thermarum]
MGAAFPLMRSSLLLCALLSCAWAISGPHIADLNVLLPPLMTNPVEYRLLGSDGCFTWEWDHHDILFVQPEYNGSSHCSVSARLVSIAPYTGRKETAVYARDVLSGIVIRCEVFIDKIFRIKIFHHSVKLDLDGITTLRAIAFDDAENVFSSLVGVQFMWQVTPISVGDDHLSPHLVHVPLKNTPLSECGGFCGDKDPRIKLEDNGLAADLYVVKGIEIGQDTVSAHMLESGFEHIADNIVLTVAEAMSVEPPSPIFVVVGAHVHYHLKVLRNNIAQAVTLPSPYHRWSVENSSVAWIDSAMGLASAVNLGVTNIVVEDTRVAGHLQLSSMHVVLPDHMVLYIQPVTISFDPVDGIQPISSFERWYLVVGQQYVIYLHVFSRDSGRRPLYITEKENLDLLFKKSAHWDISHVPDDIAVRHGWRNSSRIKALSKGVVSLSASLTFHDVQLVKPKFLTVEQEVIICDHVKIILQETIYPTKLIRLPWVPNVYQDFQLTASGGCAQASKDYHWFSSDVGVVSVSSTGVVRAISPGRAVIKVVSSFDLLNYDEVVIVVSIPSSIVMIQNFPVEVEVGGYIVAAATLTAEDGTWFTIDITFFGSSYYHRCDAFSSSTRWEVFGDAEPFKITNETGNVDCLGLSDLERAEFSRSPPCACACLYASSAGRAEIHAVIFKDLASNKHLLNTSEQPVLRAAKILVAYPSLLVYQAGDGNRFGGYRVDVPISFSSAQITSLKSVNELYLVPGTRIDMVLLGGPERWDNDIEFIESLEIVAEDMNTFNAGVRISNSSINGGTLYDIYCQDLGAYKLVFSRGNLMGANHPVSAIARTELSLACALPASIIVIANEPANTPSVIHSAIQTIRGPGNVQATPISVPNSCSVRVAAVGIHDSGKPFANSSSLCLNWEVEKCDDLAKWNDAATDLEHSGSSWEKILVLQNASGMESVSIYGGTSNVVYVVNDTKVVEIVQHSQEGHLLHLMLGARDVGGAVVAIEDVGLNPPIAASVLVLVADVEWIKILLPDKIRLMVGTSKTVDIAAGIHDGHIFGSSQYTFMNIRVHFEEELLELLNKDDYSRSATDVVEEPSFLVKAVKLGMTTLYVSARQRSGRELLSQTIQVEVYAPLAVHPSEIFLVPGASYVLAVSGGPMTGTIVEYSSTNKSSAIVDEVSGKLSAISPGDSIIHAKAYDSVGTLSCETSANVKVGIPSSMSIYLQGNQLGVGCKTPAFPTSPEGDLLSFYEVCKNYRWTVEDEQVLTFLPTTSEINSQEYFSSSGNQLKTLDGFGRKYSEFISILHGRSAGKTGIAVSFSCEFASSSSVQHTVFYNVSEEIIVVPDPPLSLGIPATWILPPFYTTKNVLPMSSQVYSYQWQKGKVIYSVMKVCGDKVHQNPFKIDGTKVKTFHSNSIGCIQATDGTTGRTEIASCVKVAEVAQVRIDIEKLPFRVIYLDLGAYLNLGVSYHDNLGYPFLEAEGVVSLTVSTNHPEIVSVLALDSENGMHSFNGTVLIKVSVGANLSPHKPILHVGDRVNFSVTGEGMSDAKSGRWFSANVSVISINKDSGKAIALGEGTTQVFFKGSSHDLQTTVTVMRDSVVLHAPSNALTNVHFPSEGYKFLIELRYVTPWKDADTAKYYCLFFPYSPEHLSHTLPIIGTTKFEVKKGLGDRPMFVSISVTLRGAYPMSGSVRLPFHSGFSVLGIHKLHLTPNANKSIITVLGNTDVKVSWHAHGLLTVARLHAEDFVVGGRAEYEVKVVQDKTFKDKLMFSLPHIGQVSEVEVSYETDEAPKSSAASESSNLLMNSLTCVVVLVATVVLFLRCFNKRQRSGQRPNLYTSSHLDPKTPIRTQDVPANGALTPVRSAPRTPQSYTEYLRRTIDETPYVRRHGRLVDPSYSY